VPGRFEFRILGPLEVLRDGAPVTVRGAKQRTLLAALLLRAGEAVSAESLIDALWGEEPPPTARTGLQVQVSKLRKLLDGVPLRTRGSGYALEVDADALDANRFDGLVEQGRRALGEGDPERATRALGSALTLWRGTPLVDVEAPEAGLAGLSALEERRLAALASWFEANLALGRHEDVLPELEGALVAGPMNERLHELGAVALYRAGRQADALEVLARLRRTLSEELGAEPGPSLGELERRILAHDPSLDEPEVEAVEEARRQGRSVVAALVVRFAGPGRDPEAGRAALDELVADAVGAIEASGGAVQEAVAERVVAVFGLPRVHEDDAARAALTALSLREPRVRAGVATGEVLVEEVGGRRTLRTAAPLALADRLARAAEPGQVLLTQEALRLAQRAVVAEPGGVLPADADGEAVVTFHATGPADAAAEVPRMRAPLVGRAEELGVLRQSFARVRRERACSLITVLGPAGIGKSRLVAEFLEGLQGATVLAGRCLPYGRDITFWPVAEIVKRAAGIRDDDDGGAAHSKIAHLVAAREDAGFITEQIAGVLGLSDVPPVPDEIAWAIRKLFEALAYDRPLVLVVDDLHWADETLLELIEHVAAWAVGSVLLLCIARPELTEARPGWGGGRLDATNLWLGPLTEPETDEMLDALLRGARLAPGAASQIGRAAEGNPLFLEELLAMLVDDGMLRWDEGTWVASEDLSAVPIPPTVHALLSARLDRLVPGERRVLERAAVVGKEFSHDDLVVLTPAGEPGPEQALDALSAKDLLTPDRHGPDRGAMFRFRHLLLRDAAYLAMSKEVRAELHARFAASLEERAGDRIAEIEEIVGYHLEAAARYRVELGLPPDAALAARAAARLLSAGRRAVARDDMPAAMSLLARGLELLAADDPARCDAAWYLTVALFESGELTRAEEVASEHVALAERAGDEASRWRLLVELADLRTYRAGEDVLDREAVAREAIAGFERLGDVAGAARAYRLLGDALNQRGRVEESGDAFVRALELAQAVGDEREATVRPTSGAVLGPMPVPRAIELVEGVLERSRRKNPDALASLGLAYAMAGRFEEARAVHAEALSRLRDLGSEFRLASCEMYRGAALLVEDDAVGAEAVMRAAVERLQRIGERWLLSSAAAELGEALYRLGRTDEAMLASLMSEDATTEEDVAAQMAWRGLRAKVLAARGEHHEAQRLARQAVGLAEGTDFLLFAADTWADLASVLEAGGEDVEAQEALARAIDLYERKGCSVGAERARARREHLEAPR
jgi:DNA-binding SARP family transcriptional activator